MTWKNVAELIVAVGFPTALKIIEIWQANPELTITAIAKLRELNRETLQDVIDAQK